MNSKETRQNGPANPDQPVAQEKFWRTAVRSGCASGITLLVAEALSQIFTKRSVDPSIAGPMSSVIGAMIGTRRFFR